MNKKEQIKAQELLKNMNLTAQNFSGTVQNLNIETKDHPHKLKLEAEQEYILINKLNETGIEIKARFIEQDIPSDQEKLIFMLGEACYAAAFKYYEPNEQTFETFMSDLTKAVKTYHKINQEKE